MSNSESQAPIVLVHGIFGFDQLKLLGVTIADYFRHIPEALRAAGYLVPNPPRLNLAGSIEERARDLKAYLEDKTNAEAFGKRVHLLAHSMGGLDARYLISRLDMADRVISLTTIGTPHHGSPIADLVKSAANPNLTRFVREHLGIKGISDLTTEACSQFNRDTPDSSTVRYFSVAGRFDPPRIFGQPFGVLGLTHDIVREKEGENDGLVSVKSATFGQSPVQWTYLDTWEANHFRLTNWGENIVPSLQEAGDNSIIEKYLSLAAHVQPLGRG